MLKVDHPVGKHFTFNSESAQTKGVSYFPSQGPEFDEEEESELTVTELREQARKQRAELEKRMTGDLSDGEEDEGKEKRNKGQSKDEDTGCSWGMGE